MKSLSYLELIELADSTDDPKKLKEIERLLPIRRKQLQRHHDPLDRLRQAIHSQRDYTRQRKVAEGLLLQSIRMDRRSKRGPSPRTHELARLHNLALDLSRARSKKKADDLLLSRI